MMFVMGGIIMIIMLLFMWGMFRDTRKNVIILAVGVLVFAVALWRCGWSAARQSSTMRATWRP